MTDCPGDGIAHRIGESGASIYDQCDPNSDLFYPIPILERRLRLALARLRWDAPLRTRAKLGKGAVARALGYPVPDSFRKTQPRFPHQNLDLFLQQSDNLQIWNEDVDPERRYAIVRLNSSNVVTAVRVVTGESVALWDRTGTLTSKFQAARLEGRQGSRLVSEFDTAGFRVLLAPAVPHEDALRLLSPVDTPQVGSVLPISEVHQRLSSIVGTTFIDPGLTNERGRGGELQKLASSALGLGRYGDHGQFPDILSQALEIKLQTSPTIDLGLISPDSSHFAAEIGEDVRHSDVRYSIFFGRRNANLITIEALVTTTGADFFSEFRRFEGLVSNRKLQIPLPGGLFDAEGGPDS